MLDRIRRLETRVDELARGTLAHAVVSSGGITIRDLGGLKLLDQDGDTVFYIGGYSGPFARPDGTPQPVTVISDDRGNARIAVFDDNPTAHPYRQYVGIWDYSGNIIVGDDARSGQGLARPYIGGTVSRARYTDWPSTAATDWDALEKLSINRQHPKLDVYVRVTTDTDPGTTGQVRLRDAITDTTLGQPENVTYSQEMRYFGGSNPLPGQFGDWREIWLEGRRTAGSGVVRATIAYANGVQS